MTDSKLPTVPAVFRLHEEVRLRDGEGLRVHLLAEQVGVGTGVHGVADAFAVACLSDRNVLLGDGQHAARSAARVVHAQYDPLLTQPSPVAGQQQVDHEVDDVAGGEVCSPGFSFSSLWQKSINRSRPEVDGVA